MEILEFFTIPQALCNKMVALLTTLFLIHDTAMTIHGLHVTHFLTRGRFKDHSLDVDPKEMVYARSPTECCVKCALTSYCKSFHFCHVQQKCVLNDRTVCDTGYSTLKSNPGCTYYDTLEHPDDEALSSVCSPSPCKNGGICSNECPQFRAVCTCTNSYYGEFCENRNGNWGGWYTYVQCGGPYCQKTRKRQCNNPSPIGAGSCSGSDTKIVQCEMDDGECGDD